MKPQLLALVPLAVFILLLALFAAPLMRGVDPAKLESAMIGREIPDFVLPAALPDGRHFDRDDLAGAPAVVNFFASWCVPCQAEQPLLARMAAQDGIDVYGVNYKDKPEALAPWLEKHGNPFKLIGADDEGRVAIEWGVYGVPETFVIDRRGVIRLRHVGPVSEADYRALFKPLIAEVMK
ncbi:MAG: DsbE family thiol:disulfide interchange protein [Alphaproteobacteria bacterium]|nr:DsbE family thiol:disulfide interchange protein [Alphaproteobacteria bacterium]